MPLRLAFPRASTLEEPANEQPVAEPDRQPLEPGPEPRVMADEVPRPRPRRGERVLDDSGDSIGRSSLGAARDRRAAERFDPLAVERRRLGRRIGTLPRPDRRPDRARLDDHDPDPPRLE